MSHNNNIIDSDGIYTIDSSTRIIKGPEKDGREIIKKLAQYDHNSERLTFKIPRYIEGHDMSESNSVMVHYLNIAEVDKTTNAGIYEITDLQINPEDETTIIGSWLISNQATQLVGSLSFVLCFTCIAEDGSVSYNWSTDIYTGVTVGETINNSGDVVEVYADVIAQWKNDISKLKEDIEKDKPLINEHLNNTKNPHGVTANQVGAYTKDEINNSVSAKIENFILEQGSISTANGVNVDGATNRIRTKNYIRGNMKITLPTNYFIFVIYYYDAETLKFLRYDAKGTSSATITNDGTVAKIVITKAYSADLTPSDIKESIDLEYLNEKIDALEVEINTIKNSSGNNEDVIAPQPYVILGDDFEIYDTTEDMSKINYAESNRNTIMSQVYSCFDELVANNSDYVTRVDLAEEVGLEYPDYATDYKTYMYKFESNVGALGNGASYLTCPKKKLLLIGGTHGEEIASPFNLYIFAKRLCDSDTVNFFKLRSAFDVYIIPCLNGYGMLNLLRGNGNGVNINRNYPVKGWTVADEGTSNYTGASAGSEFETQLVMKITKSLKPDLAIDHHNYGIRNTQFYSTVDKEELRNVMYQSAIDCSKVFVDNFPEYFGNKYFIPIINTGTSPNILDTEGVGMTSKWFAENGYISATIEMAMTINFVNGVYSGTYNGIYNNTVFTVGEYTLRNQIFKLCNYVLQN